MYLTTFINTTGNVLKLATVENGAKCPEKYGSIYDNVYANMW